MLFMSLLSHRHYCTLSVTIICVVFSFPGQKQKIKGLAASSVSVFLVIKLKLNHGRWGTGRYKKNISQLPFPTELRFTILSQQLSKYEHIKISLYHAGVTVTRHFVGSFLGGFFLHYRSHFFFCAKGLILNM